MSNYGNKLKDLIREKGVVQGNVAQMISVSPQNLSQWTNKAYPPLEGIEKICEAFEIELWEFFVDEKALDEKYGIPKEYRELIKEVLKLDEEARIDVLEMFLLSLQKYKKALSK